MRHNLFLSIVFGMFASQANAQDFPVKAPAFEAPWANYLSSSECEGEDYNFLINGLAARMTAVEGLLVMDELDGSTEGLESAMKTGSAFNALAQAALDKGCTDVARQVFLSVVETFSGEAYASIRERAKIGIDDVRALE